LDAKAITAEQRYSQRPARYTEASMVSKMEELGIGRPSTYAPTINTIQERGYVERGDKEGQSREVINLSLGAKTINRSIKSEKYGADKGKLIPTDMGLIVNDFLVEHFPDIVNYGFTAQVEEDFDQIAEGKRQWQAVIDTFYQGFHPNVEQAQTFERGSARVGARELGIDPATGLRVVASMGRFGSMVQIGTTEDGEKPRYASLQAGQSLESITLEEALELFKLPRALGQHEGEEVSVGVGRFGPYVRLGKSYTSIPKDKDPLTLSLEEAIALIQAKAEAAERSLLRSFTEENELEIRDGRFGPYIKYQGNNYKLPKGVDIQALSYEEVKQIIEQTPTKTGRCARSKTAKTSSAKAKKTSTEPRSNRTSKAKA
ncbi:MAG: topoisomerase C-terminal repeat-containing protein, partial [Porphyromonas sp.]|nr:topoisomerase C-terminal repeat-containing protein [Porphyromonas sp.]